MNKYQMRFEQDGLASELKHENVLAFLRTFIADGLKIMFQSTMLCDADTPYSHWKSIINIEMPRGKLSADLMVEQVGIIYA
jgi:hypothetical protein